MMNSTMPVSVSMLGQYTAQDGIEQAASLVDRAIQSDSNYLDLSDLLQVPKHNVSSVSGLHDFDYPCLSDPKIGLVSLTEMGDMKKVPLPAELVEQFAHMQLNCRIGLFPEISRAWVVIDSDIFVWNYEDGSDVAYFDGLSEPILSSGLVHPKRGIFQPHISHLLALTTPVDIVLLGISMSRVHEASEPEMHLLPEPLFSIPTDNVHILSVVGADNGRIFMAGKDGCLYELYYQAEDGWFTRKCRKINHSTSKLSFIVPSFLNFSFVEDDSLVQISIDNSRHVLYTRSEKGTIRVYDLGEDGLGMTHIATVSQQTSMYNATLISRTIDKSNFKSIVHIAAIPSSESVNVHLVAVTNTGVRLYYTTNPFGDNRGRPSMLTMVHVRLPPGFSASSAPNKPTNIHLAHYNKGTLMLVAGQNEDNDLLWTISPDMFSFQKHLMETQEIIPIDGHTWALAEVPSPSVGYEEEILRKGPLQRSNPPLVVTQHMERPRRFVLINFQGSYLMDKLSPVDQLKQLLLAHGGPDSTEVRAFFKLNKEDQACATCLILATSALSQAEYQVSEWATRAFFLYGGEPSEASYMTQGGMYPGGPLGMTTGVPGYDVCATPGPGFQPHMVSTPNQNMSQSFAMSPMRPGGGGMSPRSEIMYSGKHNGLCLYLARILRAIWEQRMVSDFPCQSASGQTQYLASRFRSDELSWFLEQLKAMKDFMDRNSRFTSPLMAESYAAATGHGASSRLITSRLDNTLDETRKKLAAEAESQEKASLQNLQQLINHICEALGLWKILCDHQFHIVASALTKDQQNTLKTMPFRYFVTGGKDAKQDRMKTSLTLTVVMTHHSSLSVTPPGGNDHCRHLVESGRTTLSFCQFTPEEDGQCIIETVEMASALIQCLINRYLTDNAATEAISSRLREICPSLYSSEDAVCSKANEMLTLAKGNQVKERGKKLEEALQLYKQITHQLNLPDVCNQFGAVRFYTGIVDLSMTAASKRDPQGLALHFYKNGEPVDDSQGFNAFVMSKAAVVERTVITPENLTADRYFIAAAILPYCLVTKFKKDCYHCITDTLEYLLSTSMSHPQTTSVPKAPGPPPAPDPNALSSAEAEQYTEQVFRMCLNTDDEMFHIYLYEWLINRNLTEKLLEIQSPYLEPFLTRAATVNPDHLIMLDLLWRFYEKARNYSAAAKILAKLADRHSTDLNLSQRIEYLSRATMSAKSATTTGSSATEGEFLHELEEKMEVARLQLQIYECLSKLGTSRGDIQDALSRLNSELMDITTLYGDFADVFDLSECKLAIVHCAGHCDPALVEALWQDIVEKELENTVSLPIQTRMNTLRSKLIALGRMYGGTERYFPLAFLVRYLEQRSCELQFDPANVFVFSVMQEIGITVPKLLEIYDRLFKSKDACWQAAHRPFHILAVICALLQGVADNPNVIPAYQRRPFLNTCLDAVTSYLVELQATTASSASVRMLMSDFKSLQAKLERLL